MVSRLEIFQNGLLGAAESPQSPQTALGLAGGSDPVLSSACPAAVWQACYQRYGTCTLCFCLGASCECENRCV